MEKMKKTVFRSMLTLLLLTALTCSALAAGTLIPVGKAVGLELDARGLTVESLDPEIGQEAKKAGLKEGDIIIKADGKEVSCVDDLTQAVNRAKESLVLTVLRGDKPKNITICPVEANGAKRLGIYIREGITGIGTVTYYDPASGSFGALGHGVTAADGQLLPLEEGRALDAQVVSVKKGKVGTPGQLQGSFRTEITLGVLEHNTVCGVFGKAPSGWAGTPLPVGKAEEVQPGAAVILSNLAGGETKEYEVEIVKVYPNQDTPGRNLLLHVTDPALLEKTGGIVQGMGVSYNMDNTENPVFSTIFRSSLKFDRKNGI